MDNKQNYIKQIAKCKDLGLILAFFTVIHSVLLLTVKGGYYAAKLAELPVAWACTDDYEATDFDVFTGSGDGRMRAAEISGGGCKADIEP